MIKMKSAELLRYFQEFPFRNPTQLSITAHTNPPQRVGSPYPDAVQVAQYMVLVMFNYEDLVNGEMPEGFKDFKAGPRVWGARVKDTPLVEHKGEFYLECVIMRAEEPSYWRGTELIPKEKLLLKERPVGSEGLVVRKDFKISSLKRVTTPGGPIVVEN